MKGKYFCSILLLFFSQILYAQFKEGYIITNNNDTITGFIDFKGSAQNTINCNFKRSLNDTIEPFTPGEIKAYRFTDSKYFTTNQILINDTLTPVFMEWLIMGKANVLCYTSSGLNVRYFLKADNDSLIELKNSTAFRNVSGTKYEIDKKEYVGQLKYQFSDQPSLFEDIDNTSLTAKSLIKISRKYHNLKCPDKDCMLFEDKNRKTTIDIGPTASFISSTCTLNNKNEEAVKTLTGMGYGVNVRLSNSPFLSPKISFLLGASAYDLLYEYDAHINYVEDYRIARIKYIRIPVTASYKIINKPSSPFLNLGATINYKYDYKFYDEMLINTLTRHYSYGLGMKKVQPGINAGIGYETSINQRLSMDILGSYEHLFRFFGASVGDKSYLNNFVASFTLFYRLNRAN